MDLFIIVLGVYDLFVQDLKKKIIYGMPTLVLSCFDDVTVQFHLLLQCHISLKVEKKGVLSIFKLVY